MGCILTWLMVGEYLLL